MDYKGFPYVVVGSGFFGATIAERIANEMNEKVLVIEKRSHIGGNCFSQVDPQTGVECHMYGSHIFHTVSQKVWDHINRFSSFNQYRHKVLTQFGGQRYHMPINLETINAFYRTSMGPQEVEDFLRREAAKENIREPKNFEEKALSQIGRPLYEAFFKGYTMKQWNTEPVNLSASIFSRLPVRTNANTDYFHDPYQGIPLEGYTKIFLKMLTHQNIALRLNTDFFRIKPMLSEKSLVIYSGPVDRFFDYKFGRLGWRTLRFEKECYDQEDFQGTSVVNYPQPDLPYIRTHEFKHFHPERARLARTTLFREFPKTPEGNDEPYYPINTAQDAEIFDKYHQACLREENVIFGGRLGAYKYYDMDQVIAQALAVFEQKILPRKRAS